MEWVGRAGDRDGLFPKEQGGPHNDLQVFLDQDDLRLHE